MDLMADILADTKRYRDEAVKTLAAIHAGTARLAPGMTKENAIQILTENITQYDSVIRRYGWRDDASGT